MTGWAGRLLRRRSIEAAMREEMEFHQKARAADLEKHHGLSREAAARQARIEFGSVEAYREESRAALGFRWLDELRGDVLYATRGMRKSAGFTLATIVILALAIGANAASFTLYSNYALKPLPIRGAARHFDLEGRDRHSARTFGWSPKEVAQLQEATRDEMEGIYTASGLLQVLLLAPSQRQSMISAVSANYFPLLGGHAVMGRTLAEGEERHPVAVMSDAGWKRHFPALGSPVGQVVRVRSTWFTVIGVMPPSFTGTEAAVPDFWVGGGMREALREGAGERQRAAGLLRVGAARERAEAKLSAAASRLARPGEEPVSRVALRLHATYLGADAEDTAILAPLLFAIFLLVLLIACANLANLFLARMAARRHEIAMRFALGAGRARIIRQLLTESTLLALMGAASGLALGAACLTRAHTWLFSIASSAGATVLPLTLDWRVFAYSAALGLAAGAAFGLLPAFDATAMVRRRPRRLRAVLLSSQVAASFFLLVMAGVLARNIQRFDSVRAGYDLDRTFDLQLEPPSPAVIAKLRTQPGVAAVSAVMRVPLYGRLSNQAVQTRGAISPVSYNNVDENYFDTLGLAPVSGRLFNRQEVTGNARVAVVSQGAARRLWPGTNALGQTLTLALRSEAEPGTQGTYEVVGVAPDVVNGWLFEGPESAVVYLPGAAGQARMTSAMVRLQDPSAAALAVLRELCASVPGSTGCEPKSLRDVAAMQRFPLQAAAAVSALLGGLALLLTAIGLYSVVSYSVEQRRREIGVLVAIGAQPSDVTRRVLSETMRCFVAGILVGLPFCLGLSALAASSVFRIQTFDPSAYFGVPVLMAAIAGLASLIPVRRALRVEPMAALRQD